MIGPDDEPSGAVMQRNMPGRVSLEQEFDEHWVRNM